MSKKYTSEYICELLDKAITLSYTVCNEYCSSECGCTEYQETVADCIKGLTNGTE